MNSIREIRLKTAELFEIDAQSGDEVKDLGAITMYVLKHYAFLPKPRFYRECRLAGFAVAVYDESSGGEQVFDVDQLRLRFSVTKHGGPIINVRFNPWTAEFSGQGVRFTWSELMFRPEVCLNRLFS